MFSTLKSHLMEPVQLKSHEAELIETWFRFLKQLNVHADNNRRLAIDYFTKSFATNPHWFLVFLQSLDKLLNWQDKAASVWAEKYLEVLSPLCEKYSFLSEKERLDDLCFSIRYPKAYLITYDLLQNYKDKSESLTIQIENLINQALRETSLNFQISGRYKSHYSIYKKYIKKRRKDIFSLNDIFAFRVIIDDDEAQNCFKILDRLHDEFLPVPNSFKDYINIPKINGYQSLHTGLKNILNELDLLTEVQIRTRSMHEYAENGLASHWVYAQTKKSHISDDREKKIISVSKLGLKSDEKIYCFSPCGDVFDLPRGSTAKDFAFRIHTQVGMKAKEARINKVVCKLSKRLKTGDKIEILTK